jgi:hypothetical protein
MTIIHHSAKYDAGQCVASRTDVLVFDVVLAQRGAMPLTWKQWQTTVRRYRGDAGHCSVIRL